MFKKLLIANRGEIACRIIRTAKHMGIATVAVYSDADSNALHVQCADEAQRIGSALAADSYLNTAAIIQACKKTNADAVHPGYGFLSEDTEFGGQLAKTGIEFIGPGADAIEAMGDKITSKKIARDAGVNVIPGFDDVIENPQHAVQLAQQIGYPVMLKPTSAGGGKGMRLAYNDEQCKEGFVRSQSEAKTHFGDDRVFVEKYIEQPRHIEVQVLCDKHGHAIHLGERECSLQRRHQKVIEEAPSPFLNDKTRNKITEQAVALARAVNYVSAGTVEFVVDASQDFYFLEMNTRLQVEHPVTEFVTGVDLVEWMIRIAANDELTVRQSDICAAGWSVESRIYAEDPSRNFLPSTGRLTRYRPPQQTPSVRVDSGVTEGGKVSMYYDPMIAKLIVHGESRNDAFAKMASALDQFQICGVRSNLPFLQTLVRHDTVLNGQMNTTFIGEEFPDGYDHETASSEQTELAAAIVTIAHYISEIRSATIGGQLNTRNWTAITRWVAITDNNSFAIQILKTKNGHKAITESGKNFSIEHSWNPGQRLFCFKLDGTDYSVQIERKAMAYQIDYFGCRGTFRILTPTAAQYNRYMLTKKSDVSSDFLKSPMPGLLVEVHVESGQQVRTGDTVAIIEAMKMENILRCERDGKIAKVLVNKGESVAADQPMIEFEQERV